MPTLSAGTYTQTTFTEDKWGYSINSNTAIPSTITSGYVPFQSGNTLMERSTAVNNDETELTFAAKIDYLQPAGSYTTQLNFNLVANPLVDYIQDFTIDMCRTVASSDDYTVVDKRDNNDYTVRYINGNCWMTQNLRFVGTTLDPATSNVASTTSITYGDLTSGDSYDQARIHTGVDSNGDPTVWYNYAAASAMTITGSSNTNPQTYDVCPKGWRLPTETEESSIIDYKTQFNLVAGGMYRGGNLAYPGYGYWWASTVFTISTYRYVLSWGDNVLNTGGDGRWYGNYVRCIANDSRDLNDSTVVNMQDINKQIVANTADGATKTLTDSRDGQEYTVAKINGNLWMTRNLAIGCNGTGSTYGNTITPIELTPANTNITSNWTTPSLSATSGYDFVTPRMECSDTYGAWYDFAAASAGTYTGGSMYTQYSTTYNICPAGWTLPLMSQFSTLGSPFGFPGGGYYHNATYTGGNQNYWWSSDMNSSSRNCMGGNYAVSCTNSRADPIYVRCIAK